MEASATIAAGGATTEERKGFRVQHALLLEEPPTRLELFGWYAYGVCSHFVHCFLLPILFPLMVAQRATAAHSHRPPSCSHRDYWTLYQMVVERSIAVGSSTLSPLHLTAISWLIGTLLAASILPYFSRQLDRGHHSLVLTASTVSGAFCCILTGFFKTTFLFPLYIAAVTIAITIASASHTRQLGLILASSVKSHQRPLVSSRLSMHATAAANLSTAVIAVFAYQMLRRADHLTSLWVVAIFAGLMWAFGIVNALTNRPESSHHQPSRASISDYCPRAFVALVGAFLASFSSTCLFTSTTLYLVGGLCIKPVILLSLWIAYFAFAAISLPLLHPVQLLIRADAATMTLLGFFVSAFSSGLGFYFKDGRWKWANLLLVTLVQSTGAGVLHAFGRVMVLDRSPVGKESVFSMLFEWVKMSGAFAGFAVAAVRPKDIKTTYGVSFLAAFIGIIVLLFGNRTGLGQDSAETHGEERSDGAMMIGLSDKDDHRWGEGEM